MWDYVKLIALAGVAFLAALAANFAHDLPYMVNALVVMIAAAITFIYVLRHAGEEVRHDQSQYMDGVVRAGVIATAFWGIVGFLVGVVIAFQLAFPALNIDNVFGILNFGRLRPLHKRFGRDPHGSERRLLVDRRETTDARRWFFLFSRPGIGGPTTHAERTSPGAMSHPRARSDAPRAGPAPRKPAAVTALDPVGGSDRGWRAHTHDDLHFRRTLRFIVVRREDVFNRREQVFLDLVLARVFVQVETSACFQPRS